MRIVLLLPRPPKPQESFVGLRSLTGLEDDTRPGRRVRGDGAPMCQVRGSFEDLSEPNRGGDADLQSSPVEFSHIGNARPRLQSDGNR